MASGRTKKQFRACMASSGDVDSRTERNVAAWRGVCETETGDDLTSLLSSRNDLNCKSQFSRDIRTLIRANTSGGAVEIAAPAFDDPAQPAEIRFADPGR